MSTPVQDVSKDARALIDWLYAQADLIYKHDPAMEDDIGRLRAAADLLGAYAGGLALAEPDPVTLAELVRWIPISDVQPPVAVPILLYSSTNEEVFIGLYDGNAFYDDSGDPWVFLKFSHWAPLLVGPVRPAAEAQS